jgi:hypothetical protein
MGGPLRRSFSCPANGFVFAIFEVRDATSGGFVHVSRGLAEVLHSALGTTSRDVRSGFVPVISSLHLSRVFRGRGGRGAMLALAASKHRDAAVRVLRVSQPSRFHHLDFENPLILLDDLASFRNFE